MEGIEDRIRRLIVRRLKLAVAPETIADTQPLFGKEGLGLDSIDALELVVGLEEEFGIRIGDEELDRTVFRDVQRLGAFVRGKTAPQVAS